MHKFYIFLAIEGHLYQALYDTQFIIPQNFTQSLDKIGWQKSSRTDKGVHSVASVVSCKLEVDLQKMEHDDMYGIDMAGTVNAALPSDIRVFCMQKTPNSFNARNDCSWREYEYLIPTSACKNGHVDLNKMNAILSKFVGTKMFHNFTQNLVNNRVKQKQKNSEEQPEDVQPKQFTRMENGVSKLQPMDENTIYNRNIFYFKATKVIHVNNQQFILVKVSGNGFLYNQIRKMVACMLCVYNDYYDASTFLDIALESDVKVNLPIAPPETLLLNNMGFRPRKNVMYMDFSHEKIVAERDQFKMEYIYPEMVRAMQENNSFEQFFSYVEKYHLYPKEEYQLMHAEAVKFLQWRTEYKAQKEIKAPKEYTFLPNGLVTKICTHYGINPEQYVYWTLFALEDLVKQRQLQQNQTQDYYIDFVDQVHKGSLQELSVIGKQLADQGAKLQYC